MVLVEMSFRGAGGLEELVGCLTEAVEAALGRQSAQWKEGYPITLRESLRMGLQQQIVGGRPSPNPGRDGEAEVYRVWVALPDGGLRVWTQELGQRVLDGCGLGRGSTPKLTRALQNDLVDVLGPCLQKAEATTLLPGPPVAL